MAYASKYYDPVKAHEYYLKTRELKGYEDRYGGARGDGISAASGMSVTDIKKSDNSGKNNSSSSSLSVSDHNANIKSQIQSLRDSLNGMSAEDRKANRNQIQDQIQSLRQQTKGGSTSGFNQKGKEAAAYIKSQIETERDDVIKKANDDTDKEMLSKVKKLGEQIKQARESGQSISSNVFLSKIRALTGEAKKTKIRYKRQYTSEYKQRYKDEIDKLRQDETMFTYYDKKKEREAREAEKARIKAAKEKERAEKKAAKEAARKEKLANKASRTISSSKKSSGVSLDIADYLDEDTKRMAISSGMTVSGDLSDTIDDNWLRQFGRIEDVSTKEWKEEYNAMNDEEKNSDYGRELRSIIQYNEAVNTISEERMRRLGI